MSPLHAPLLQWFDAHHRDLPWRRSKDPYSIWVSEIMLQQTQVATVIPFFERWMAKFPTVQDLAKADEQDVLTLWQGLGYYRRARLLLRGAQAIGPSRLPRTAAEWLEVPGIGPYTAGAIASIALNEAVPLVDGNVERVFARLTGSTESGPSLNKAAWLLSRENVHQTRPGDWNQALMELGATVCKPIEPLCSQCPVSAQCVAFATNRQSQLPVMLKKAKPVPLTHHVWVPIHGSLFGVRQIPEGEWWEGMWEFPRSASEEELGNQFPDAWPEVAGSFKHAVTNHRIQVHVSKILLDQPHDDLRWLSRTEITEIPMPTPQRKALRLATT